MGRHFTAEVLSNSPVGNNFRLLSIAPPPDVTRPEPGSFYMLQAGHGTDPLIKRPFSVFRWADGVLSFLYRLRGKGTLSLSAMGPGDFMEAIGPLGKGYPLPEADFIVVAGGIGIASVFPLLQRQRGRAYLFYGARNKEELVMSAEAEALSKKAFITTDDGSAGIHGLVTDELRVFLEDTDLSIPVYACGPKPMLRALPAVLAGRGLECFVSLEEHMACGVGACLGCVTKIKEAAHGEAAYQRVCKEGPVFKMEAVVWD